MNRNFPVYTVQNTCQDCFKCVRHCPCKAIRVENGSASVIPELCVSCGRCVRVCPAHAKKIRSDLSRARLLFERRKQVFVSLAPSFRSYFRSVPEKSLIAALLKAGFTGVSETALGAEIVSAETAKYIAEHGKGVYLSSACPAAVDYLRKYAPEYAARIVPVASPLLAHCKMLRRTYGEDIGIVFFGPCAAKKSESDRHEDQLDLALTFADLEEFLRQENINMETLPGEGAQFVPHPAREGRIYPFEGGMNDTMRLPGDETHYLTLSGLLNFDRVLRSDRAAAENKDIKLFIECLACDGGCINGPVMGKSSGSLSDIIRTGIDYGFENSVGREVPVAIGEEISASPAPVPEVSEKDIQAALQLVGKNGVGDELNCGGCGYFTCRSFAKALIQGKAETSMCLSYLRKMAQKKSNALIRYIPSGVVIADQHLKIIECNEHFATLFDESTRLAYEATPGLPGVDLVNIVSFTELFEEVLSSGGELRRDDFVVGEKIFDISVFTIEPHRIVGAIVQDVTVSELRREQISEKAREVIQKNVITVQKIAHYLGEHMAETEILLREVASGYDNSKVRKDASGENGR